MNDTNPPPSTGRFARGHDATTLPQRAVNLARRMLELERQCGGRGRVEFQVVMVDGQWLLMISKPGPIEWLGE